MTPMPAETVDEYLAVVGEAYRRTLDQIAGLPPEQRGDVEAQVDALRASVRETLITGYDVDPARAALLAVDTLS